MLTLLALSDAGRGLKHDVNNFMTQEEIDAKAAADAAAKEEADAEFEATLGDDLTDEEKEAKRQEHAAQSNDNNDKELDKEIAEEEERARKAADAFEKREVARKAREAAAGNEDDDEDKPLTRRDMARISEQATAAAMKVANQAQVLAIAKTLATSDKEATLIAAKWANRSFPEGMTLQDQVEEMYAVTNRKKLIGERNEALRAVRNKGTAGANGAATHRDGPTPGEPKLNAADKTALEQSGFVWDAAKRMYKKPLRGGKLHLYRDVKGNRTFTAV